MIRLSGKEPGVDIAIAYTGLRPGEKLYEELLASTESTLPTHHPRILIGQVAPVDAAEVERQADELLAAPGSALHHLLRRFLPEYAPATASAPPVTSPANSRA